MMTTRGEFLPYFKTSKSLGQLIKDLNKWTGGSTDTTFKRMIATWLDSNDTADMPEKLRANAEGFLARTTPTNEWVVYEHREPETQEVRYVGMGRPARAWSSQRTIAEHSERLRNNELEVVLVLRGLSETEALAEEAIRIRRYHSKTGTRLYNLSIPGG